MHISLFQVYLNLQVLMSYSCRLQDLSSCFVLPSICKEFNRKTHAFAVFRMTINFIMKSLVFFKRKSTLKEPINASTPHHQFSQDVHNMVQSGCLKMYITFIKVKDIMVPCDLTPTEIYKGARLRSTVKINYLQYTTTDMPIDSAWYGNTTSNRCRFVALWSHESLCCAL